MIYFNPIHHIGYITISEFCSNMKSILKNTAQIVVNTVYKRFSTLSKL